MNTNSGTDYEPSQLHKVVGDLRSVVNHQQNGKGSKSRITDLRRYRENFSEINWGPRTALRPGTRLEPIFYKRQRERTLEELRDEYEFRMGL